MLKFIIPAVVIFLIILFWEKINEMIYKKFNLRINYIVITIILLFLAAIFTLLYFWYMQKKFSLDHKLIKSDGVFTFKNPNTTIGFVRFNKNGEVEYIFVNPIFRKKGFAKKLLKLVKKETGKKISFQKPISPLGSKLISSLDN